MKTAQGPSFRALLRRTRGKIRRERAAAEEEEHQGGELNLVPYLDILVNTIIFLLATTAFALPVANINARAPREVDDRQQQARPSQTNLTVAISYSGFVVGGAGGVIRNKGAAGPTIPCKVSLRQGRCPRYDYAALEALARKIKAQYPKERTVILTADRWIPYGVMVKTMDALRGRITARCTLPDGCLFDTIIFSAGVS